jgi:anti-anti-sigma factor
MKTQIKKTGDAIIVTMEGKLDFENQDPIRNELTRIAQQANKDSTPRKLIFDLEKLQFVGSSGISSFIQTLKDVNSIASEKPRFCNVKSEFQKVIKAFDEENEFTFFENEEKARRGQIDN